MKEHIKKEALKRAVEREFDMQDLYLPVHFLMVADSIPPADVKPVVRGEWKLLSHNGDKTSDYECTACYGIISDVPDDDEHDLCPFCPNCGAEMRKEDTHED